VDEPCRGAPLVACLLKASEGECAARSFADATGIDWVFKHFSRKPARQTCAHSRETEHGHVAPRIEDDRDGVLPSPVLSAAAPFDFPYFTRQARRHAFWIEQDRLQLAEAVPTQRPLSRQELELRG